MPALQELPYEILLEILSLLPCIDLASTIRVSHRLQHISQPLLYKAPCLTKVPSYRRARPSIEIFLRTLLAPGHESLSSHVRVLSLKSSASLAKRTSRYRSHTIDLIRAMASKHNIRNPLTSQKTQLMLLLDLLPYLQVLYLSPNACRLALSDFLAPSMAAGTLPRGLQSLQEFHCSCVGDGYSVEILPLFKLPSIRTIDVPGCNRYMMSVPDMEAAVATSPVTHLRIWQDGDPCAIGHVLRIPIALTRFSYTATADFNTCTALSDFMANLAPLRPSLQYLHLNFSHVYTGYADVEPLLPYGAGSLREWPVLRTLSCSLMPLLGKQPLLGSPRLADMLPPGLCEFKVLSDLFWCVPNGEDQVLEMLERKEREVPRLAKISVHAGWEESQGLMDKVTTACEAAGVSFVEESFSW